MDALMKGSYDGAFRCEELLRYGDSGLGTFDRLDGEMVILDGQIYQVRADGKPYLQNGECTAPYASLTVFLSATPVAVPSPAPKKALEAMLNGHCRADRICAVRVRGIFSRMKVRSVPPQEEPYPPLMEAIKKQTIFDLTDVRGTMIGFRTPASFAGVGAAGDHFHFLSDARDSGGHVLDFEVGEGTLEVENADAFELFFPEHEEKGAPRNEHGGAVSQATSEL